MYNCAYVRSRRQFFLPLSCRTFSYETRSFSMFGNLGPVIWELPDPAPGSLLFLRKLYNFRKTDLLTCCDVRYRIKIPCIVPGLQSHLCSSPSPAWPKRRCIHPGCAHYVCIFVEMVLRHRLGMSSEEDAVPDSYLAFSNTSFEHLIILEHTLQDEQSLHKRD